MATTPAAGRERAVHALNPEHGEPWTDCGTSMTAETRFATRGAPEVTCHRCLLAQARRSSG